MHGSYLWKTLRILIYVFDSLYFARCITSFSSINHLLQLCARFLILFHLTWMGFSRSDGVVFGDFNVHHKDWLTYSSGNDRPGELSYNFSISNDLTQITFLLGSQILIVLLFWVCFFLLTLVFVLQWLSLL